ncbi:MAG: hypothetical protein NHB15_01300 [Methanosarcina barkeri]|nr:hypothetical protein [Methanosarcina sp. ERenArc_MAG2]
MSVKIKWQIFTAETRSDGTWRSNSPTLEELLNVMASPDRIKERTTDIEDSMARLAIRGLPYFKITEVTSGNKREKTVLKNLSESDVSINRQVKPTEDVLGMFG